MVCVTGITEAFKADTFDKKINLGRLPLQPPTAAPVLTPGH